MRSLGDGPLQPHDVLGVLECPPPTSATLGRLGASADCSPIASPRRAPTSHPAGPERTFLPLPERRLSPYTDPAAANTNAAPLDSRPKRMSEETFRDYRPEGADWITLSTGEFYADVQCGRITRISRIVGQAA